MLTFFFLFYPTIYHYNTLVFYKNCISTWNTFNSLLVVNVWFLYGFELLKLIR